MKQSWVVKAKDWIEGESLDFWLSSVRSPTEPGLPLFAYSFRQASVFDSEEDAQRALFQACTGAPNLIGYLRIEKVVHLNIDFRPILEAFGRLPYPVVDGTKLNVNPIRMAVEVHDEL